MTVIRYVPLVVKQVIRHRVRTLLTVSGIAIAMFLFTTIQAMQRGVTAVTSKCQSDPSSGDGLKSFINRWYAASNESWSFQLLKSGMKYSRISAAVSIPLSASNNSHS